MAKFTGPAEVTSVHLSSGPVPVKDGIAEVLEPTQGDIAGLAANGFSLVAEGAYFALPADPEPEALARAEDPAPAHAEPEAEADHAAE